MNVTATCAILISRQGLHPCRLTAWVSQTHKAIQWVKANHFNLCTSLGQTTWELTVFLAQKEGLHQRIVIPSKNPDDFECQKNRAVEQFQLDMKRVQFQAVFSNDPKSVFYLRDYKIVSESDILIPISVRNKGHMDTLMSKKHKDNPDALMKAFQIDYQKKNSRIAYHVTADKRSQEIVHLSPEYLIHWTRASNTPWPTETKSDYFESIMQDKCYPRHALATLENILTTGRLIASDRHMPQKIATVSFSALPPHKAMSLMHWRARYRQMSFEPYGIGIEKRYASMIGIHAVHYYDRLKKKPGHIDPWLCQSTGTLSNWTLEQEYRCLGDLNLSGIPSEKLICFCYQKDEAENIQQKFGIKTLEMVRN
ncbi:MAG: hypothetical protein HQK75_15905 [Candidatus Magnetomorum sp.]|nr:hypothetical protein [Candidatus Magnetomorum sp.]